MRLFNPCSVLFMSLMLVGCSNEPESVTGRWSCITTHPGGFQSTDIFNFLDNGQMTLDSDGMVMHGNYTLAKPTLTMALVDVPVPTGMGPDAVQQQTLAGTIRSFSSEKLEMSISTGQDKHLSQCRHL